MTHALVLLAIMAIDHWLAKTERIAAASILDLIFRVLESILIRIRNIISRKRK